MLDYDKIAVSLGVDDLNATVYRRLVNRSLRKLARKYKLIHFKVKRNEPAQITMIDFGRDFIELPAAYWDYGWNKTLSFPSKVMSLVMRNYSSPSRPAFRLSRRTLSERHHISDAFITDGTKELKKFNLLRIRYGAFKDESHTRDSNVYTPRPFYDPLELKKELERLGEKHGLEKLDRAVHVAEAVFAENDPQVVQTLIDLENKYGEETVRAAADQVAQKNPDNPKRNAGYLINAIKHMGERKSMVELPA